MPLNTTDKRIKEIPAEYGFVVDNWIGWQLPCFYLRIIKNEVQGVFSP